MEPWVWVIAAVVALSACQLLVLRWLSRSTEPTPATFAGDPRHPSPRQTEDGRVYCPHCGTPNRAEFTYCRSCVRTLASL